jgi:hypothetical protein
MQSACRKSANDGHRGLAHEPLGCHRKVVLHWGELGTRWGISPTVHKPHRSANPRPAVLSERAERRGDRRRPFGGALQGQHQPEGVVGLGPRQGRLRDGPTAVIAQIGLAMLEVSHERR